MASIAVLGIGNNLLTDDGAGIHALEQFAQRNPHKDVIGIDAGTVGLALMDRLCGLDGVIAVDAMRSSQDPGTVTVLEGDAMDAYLRQHHGSVHELGLSDLLDALRLSGELPEHRALVGIEPADLGWGTQTSAPVAAALPVAVDHMLALVQTWKTALEAAA